MEDVFYYRDKVHFYNHDHNTLVPEWDESKKQGYKATECGYLRKNTTSVPKQVTCKLCLRAMHIQGIIK